MYVCIGTYMPFYVLYTGCSMYLLRMYLYVGTFAYVPDTGLEGRVGHACSITITMVIGATMTVLHPITMVIGPCTAVLPHKALTTVCRPHTLRWRVGRLCGAYRTLQTYIST